MTGTITLRSSKMWRVVAHNLEHLDPKNPGGKPPQTVECYGEMELDLSDLIQFIRGCKNRLEAARGLRVRPSALAALAARRVLSRGEFCLLNGYWKACPENREKDEIVLYKDVHLGISYDRSIPAVIDEVRGTIDGPRLCIPTLHVPSTELVPFLSALDGLVRRVDQYHVSGRLVLSSQKELDDLRGHTFIFNNLGALGHTAGGSRLTAHTSAMLNMCIIARDGKTTFQLFFDHRMFDGSMVTRFLKALHEELTVRIVDELGELLN